MQCFKPLVEWMKIGSKSFEGECLDMHNWYRAQHGCPPLKLNKALNKHASDWAKALASAHKMEHSSCHNYGENIYLADGLQVSGKMPVKAWYDEIQDYNFFKAEYSPDIGHFTQLIWKSSKEVGIGVATEGDLTIVVAHYTPRGNVRDKFKENVPLKLRGVSVQEPNTTLLPAALRSRHLVFSETDKRFHQECLIAHNFYRERHKCPPLKLNNDLSSFATNWAQILAKRNVMNHSTGHNLGENIYRAEGARIHGYMPVKAWYAEIKDYDYKKAEFSKITGHFTQIIWKGTKELGVGLARRNKVTVVVASYSPFGNVRGQFRENVPPKMQDNASVDSFLSVSTAIKSSTKKRSSSPTELKIYFDLSDMNITAQNFTDSERVFQRECLEAHNNYREMHNCPHLRLNDKLSTYASNWAEALFSLDSLQQSPSRAFGENVYMSVGLPVNGEVPVKIWYNGIESYDFKKANFVPSAGGFTQVVWKNSEQLGVGLYQRAGKTFVVASYLPPGNMVGRFKENVLPRVVLDHTTAHHAEKL